MAKQLEFDTQKGIAAQIAYCEKKKVPLFFPSRTGRCFSCKRDIFQPEYKKRVEGSYTFVAGTAEDHDRVIGIDVAKASSELITGCPFCFRSFCD